MKVREIMTEPPLTCTGETTVAVAARLMGEADYGTLPVVDAQRMVVGIVTDRDICLALARTHRNAVNIKVREIMTRTVRTAHVDDDVHAALATMKSTRVRRLPVCDEKGHLTGILSIEDFVVRGFQGRGINPGELVEALRAMYLRAPVPVAAEMSALNNRTPG